MFFLFAFLLVASAAQSKVPLGDSTCSFCEFVVSTCEGFVLNNATETEIINWLGNACTLLPSPYNALCSQELNQYGSEVIQWIANNENPEVVCQQLHLCTSSLKKAVPEKAQVTKPLQSSCSICELVVSYAENYLQNNGTIAGLEKELGQVCAVLPSPYNAQCTAFVQQQLPALVQWLVNNEPPQQFCAQVGLCSSVHKKEEVVPVVVHKTLQSSCSVCELVLNFAEGYLQSNSTISELEAQLGNLCNVIPSPFNSECVALVNAYTPEIIQWILTNESPQKFCTQVGLCSSAASASASTTASARLPVVHKALQSSCSVCELVLNFAEGYLQSNSTVAELEAELDNLCNVIPSPFNSQCVALVSAYTPEIIQWVLTNESPAQFCTQIGLCSSAGRHSLKLKKVVVN